MNLKQISMLILNCKTSAGNSYFEVFEEVSAETKHKPRAVEYNKFYDTLAYDAYVNDYCIDA